MRKKRKMAGLLLCILLLAGLNGCGAGEATKDSSTSQAEEKNLHDLSGGGWKSYEEIADSGEAWSASGYWDDIAMDAAYTGMVLTGRCSTTDGESLYILKSYDAAGETTDQKYCLARVNMLSMESEPMELNLQAAVKLQTGEEAELTGPVVDMEVLDGKISLLFASWADGRTTRAYVLLLDESGETEGMTDLLPGLEQSGILQGGGMPRNIARDGEGHYYVSVRDSVGTSICVLDEDGSFLTLLTSSGGTDTVSRHTCRLQDGRPVFECRDFDSQTLTVFCLEKDQEKILYHGQGTSATARYINPYGEILWLNFDGILRWNAAEGKCERFYQNHGLSATGCEAVVEGPEGEIIIACYDRNVTSLYRLQSGESAEQTELRIFQLYESDKMKEIAAEYSRKHPETTIVVESIGREDDKTILLNRLMAQMTMGEGPDILMLSRDQLEILQDKGALASLSDAVPRELQEQIFKGVLLSGTIGNELYGIGSDVSVSTLLVSKEVWNEETWTFQDVLAIMEEREKSGNPYDRFISLSYSMTAENMLFNLALFEVGKENSSLVDLEQGKCYFDTPEFIGLLEACRKYGEAPGSRSLTKDEQIAEMKNGKALVYPANGNLASFSRDMAMFGDEYRCVGYPTTGASGHAVNSYSLAAVNAGTQHYEAAVDFLNYLLSEEVQIEWRGITTVRRDVLTAHVVGSPTRDTPAFIIHGNSITPLDGKPDGTSWLQEYLEVLDAGVPESWMYNGGIRGIIREEAGAFFAGDKSAEDVAKLIQNKVQLYLDERK